MMMKKKLSKPFNRDGGVSSGRGFDSDREDVISISGPLSSATGADVDMQRRSSAASSKDSHSRTNSWRNMFGPGNKKRNSDLGSAGLLRKTMSRSSEKEIEGLSRETLASTTDSSQSRAFTQEMETAGMAPSRLVQAQGSAVAPRKDDKRSLHSFAAAAEQKQQQQQQQQQQQSQQQNASVAIYSRFDDKVDGTTSPFDVSANHVSSSDERDSDSHASEQSSRKGGGGIIGRLVRTTSRKQIGKAAGDRSTSSTPGRRTPGGSKTPQRSSTHTNSRSPKKLASPLRRSIDARRSKSHERVAPPPPIVQDVPPSASRLRTRNGEDRPVPKAPTAPAARQHSREQRQRSLPITPVVTAPHLVRPLGPRTPSTESESLSSIRRQSSGGSATLPNEESRELLNVLDMLRKDESAAQVEMALKSLYLLFSDKEASSAAATAERYAFQHGGGYEYTVACVKHYETIPMVQISGLKSLALVASGDSFGLKYLADARIDQLAFAYLNDPAASSAVKAAALVVLLVQMSWPPTLHSAANIQTVRMLNGLMVAHEEHAEVQGAACGILSRILPSSAVTGPDLVAAKLPAQIVQSILSSLQAHAASSECVIHGCSALRHLMNKDGVDWDIVAGACSISDLIRSLFNVLVKHPQNPIAIECALGVLERLSRGGGSISSNGGSSRNDVSASTPSAAVSSDLGALMSRSTNEQDVRTLVSVLKAHAMRLAIMEPSVSVLISIVGKDADHQKIFMTEGGTARILFMVERYPRAARLMALISQLSMCLFDLSFEQFVFELSDNPKVLELCVYALFVNHHPEWRPKPKPRAPNPGVPRSPAYAHTAGYAAPIKMAPTK